MEEICEDGLELWYWERSAIPTLSLIAFSLLIAGGIGIVLIGLYLAFKTRWRRFTTYSLLIAIWFWGYGLGMLRGLLKAAR
jgi:hypothetical protein